MVSICEGCDQKQRKINALEEEVLSLKARLRYQEWTAKEGLFKSSTPSSNKPTKANSSPENCSKQGGAKVGHKGNGRKSLSSHQADREAYLDVGERCPDWADDPKIPAENNLSERQLRPLVIARKISFGSQSDRGARTREILMTVLNTLKKRCSDIGEVYDRFKSVLDALSEESRRDAYRLLFEPDTS